MVTRDRDTSIRSRDEYLPNGLHKSEIPDYLLSKSFEKRAGVWLPRRDVLLGLAGTAAYAAMPIRPAKAISGAQLGATLDVLIKGVELGNALWEIGERITGRFSVENNEPKPQAGIAVLAILDDDDEIEVSQGRHYKIPKHTDAELTFHKGPAPEEAGNKTFYVLSKSNYETTDFEAVEA